MLSILARQRALTRDQFTGLFFGSRRRCQAALAHMKRLDLIRHVAFLPHPLSGSAPRAYLLTARGADAAAQLTGIPRKILRLRAARTGRSGLHIEHTLAMNEFYVKLLEATRAAGGELAWLGEDAVRVYYAKQPSGKPTLTPDGAGEVTLGDRRVRAFFEIDRGTERRLWLQAKFQRYMRHLAGRLGADDLHVLVVVPDGAREVLIHRVGTYVLRWAERPAPGIWTTTEPLLRELGPLGAAWLRVPQGTTRTPLAEIRKLEPQTP